MSNLAIAFSMACLPIGFSFITLAIIGIGTDSIAKIIVFAFIGMVFFATSFAIFILAWGIQKQQDAKYEQTRLELLVAIERLGNSMNGLRGDFKAGLTKNDKRA